MPIAILPAAYPAKSAAIKLIGADRSQVAPHSTKRTGGQFFSGNDAKKPEYPD